MSFRCVSEEANLGRSADRSNPKSQLLVLPSHTVPFMSCNLNLRSAPHLPHAPEGCQGPKVVPRNGISSRFAMRFRNLIGHRATE